MAYRLEREEVKWNDLPTEFEGGVTSDDDNVSRNKCLEHTACT